MSDGEGERPSAGEAAAPAIVFLDRGTIPPDARIRAPAFRHRWIEHERTPPEAVRERCADASVVVLNKVRLDADAIAASPRLRLVAVAATGTDIVDLAAARAHGVVVSNVRNYAAHSVPEHVFALVLALRRSLLPYRDSVRDGAWQAAGQFCYFDFPRRDLAGATLGIVGSGVLGRAVARLGEAFGMRVLFAARKGASRAAPPRVPFPDVLRESDVLSLHCPLTPDTRNLIGDPEFGLMERRPLLINTARGGLVDEAALVRALDRGAIAGAGLDVATDEPPPAAHPVMTLAARANVIVTPHVAWASREAAQALVDQLVDNIEAFWAGRPANVVA